MASITGQKAQQEGGGTWAWLDDVDMWARGELQVHSVGCRMVERLTRSEEMEPGLAWTGMRTCASHWR